MNYEQRTKAIGAWLQKELQSYDVPANHTPERAATEMTAMVEDINSEIVSSINEEGLTNILRNMGKDIRKNNRTRSWPTIYNMVKAAQKCSDAYKPPILGPSKSVAWDSDAINARRMNHGEAVADNYITGSGADRLLEKNLVTMNVIQMYRQSLEENRIETYATKRAASRPNRGLPVLMRPKQLRAKDLRAFAIVPIRAIKDPRITPKTLRVLIAFCSYCDSIGRTFVSNERIGQDIGSKRTAVGYHVRKLRDYGYMVYCRAILQRPEIHQQPHRLRSSR